MLEKGYCLLSTAFRTASPGTKYTPERAHRMLLQMPLVAVRIGNPSDGNAYTILMEKYEGVNYAKVILVMEGLTSTTHKTCVKMLLTLANCDRERECLRYAIFKASGVSQTQARHRFGFESMSKRSAKVEQVLVEVERIHEAVDDLAKPQDMALLETFGIHSQESNDSESELNIDECPGQSGGSVIPSDVLKMSLESSNFNWFECIHQLKSQFSIDTTTKLTQTILHQLPDLKLSKQQEQLVLLSVQAFIAAKNDQCEDERVARMVNGDIVTDSESDNPEDYCGLKNVLSETGRTFITKRRASIKRRAQRERARVIAEQRFLSRNITKHVSINRRICEMVPGWPLCY